MAFEVNTELVDVALELCGVQVAQRSGEGRFAARGQHACRDRSLVRGAGWVVAFDDLRADAFVQLCAGHAIHAARQEAAVAAALDRPVDAALHIDKKWDVFLDDLPDFGEGSEGREVDSGSAPVPPGSPA